MAKNFGGIRRNREAEQEYNYHLPVMLQETLNLLVTNPNGIYIDGTLGGGGHAAEIVKRLDSGCLYAFDADEEAILHCRGAFADELARGEESRIALVHANYSDFELACSKKEKIREDVSDDGGIAGMLLDLGVSSRQLDSGGRGISHRFDSPLDMRFGGSAHTTASEIINTADESELLSILRTYGEEPFARPIVRRIMQRRNTVLFTTTGELRAVVEESVPPPQRAKALARVFQAFRIAVNRELEVLEETLRNVIPHLTIGGRIVVITYHSLEDRIVKHIFKEESTTIHATMPGEITIPARMKLLTPKPMLPTEEEILRNPRARSAKVRAVEKVLDK
ncbi:MAG: 16S rRNA (cytosine(1402)-N(4))-methyltransferase RsmH [Candidatus Kapaibacterium sp.]|nr:16S rRNA (cytosine(1402)-N(4))-methyltransferase RsmH [Bacteroidota bacterium]